MGRDLGDIDVGEFIVRSRVGVDKYAAIPPTLLFTGCKPGSGTEFHQGFILRDDQTGHYGAICRAHSTFHHCTAQ